MEGTDATALLLRYLECLAIVAGVTWASIKGLQRLTTKHVERLALVVGMGLALVFHLAGFLDAPIPDPWDWVVTAVMGVVGTLMAAGATNVNVTRIFGSQGK